MATFKKWNRAEHVDQAGGEEALAATRRIVDEFIDDWQLRVGKLRKMLKFTGPRTERRTTGPTHSLIWASLRSNCASWGAPSGAPEFEHVRHRGHRTFGLGLPAVMLSVAEAEAMDDAHHDPPRWMADPNGVDDRVAF
ncbi:hypothetical protein [Nonomuraea sp. NPDC023979]|uniref:hypothetical protein n=1 Tax=Nonomuraea sp. NPDC023979 TaxID=3154796 RepID=UPI0034065AF0